MAEKWKPEIKSPGDAWMDHVEKHHGASAVTPAYLKPEEKGAGVQAIEKKMAELQKQMDGQEANKSQNKEVDPGKFQEQIKEQEKVKDKGKENGPSR